MSNGSPSPAWASSAQVEDRILFDGGPALNRGLVAAVEAEAGRELLVPEEPQTTTANGRGPPRSQRMARGDPMG